MKGYDILVRKLVKSNIKTKQKQNTYKFLSLRSIRLKVTEDL